MTIYYTIHYFLYKKIDMNTVFIVFIFAIYTYLLNLMSSQYNIFIL